MQDAKAIWRSSAVVAPVERDLAAYAGGASLDDCPALHELMHGHAQARSFAQGMARQFAEALRCEPLGEVPFRHRSSGGFTRLQLMQERGAMLSLCAYEPDRQAEPTQSVLFVDASLHEIVIAGAAQVAVYRLDGLDAPLIDTQKRRWQAGEGIALSPRREARQVIRVEQTLLTLQLTRTPERPRPTHEYRLADHALLKTTSGDRRASEQVMALGVLGALGDRRCIAPMTTFALRGEGDTDARWEAVRQVLAMDAGAGMELLDQLAGRASDALCAPASDLAASLRRQHPQLRDRRVG